jgi:hypothetical protein
VDEVEAKALRMRFPDDLIGQIPKGGVQLDYVGHAAVTDRLLQVDPTWTWEPAGYTEHGLPMFDGNNGLWIKLTVCGVTRYGYGDGPDPKQCISDAIRNAAMRFGVALDLWSKEDLKAPALLAGTETAAQELASSEAAAASSEVAAPHQGVPGETPGTTPDAAVAGDPVTLLREHFGSQPKALMAARAKFGEGIHSTSQLTPSQVTDLLMDAV